MAGVDVFRDPDLQVHVDKYLKNNARAYEAAMADDEEIPDSLTLTLEKAAATGALKKMRVMGAALCLGGEPSRPMSSCVSWPACYPSTDPPNPTLVCMIT